MYIVIEALILMSILLLMSHKRIKNGGRKSSTTFYKERSDLIKFFKITLNMDWWTKS